MISSSDINNDLRAISNHSELDLDDSNSILLENISRLSGRLSGRMSARLSGGRSPGRSSMELIGEDRVYGRSLVNSVNRMSRNMDLTNVNKYHNNNARQNQSRPLPSCPSTPPFLLPNLFTLSSDGHSNNHHEVEEENRRVCGALTKEERRNNEEIASLDADTDDESGNDSD